MSQLINKNFINYIKTRNLFYWIFLLIFIINIFLYRNIKKPAFKAKQKIAKSIEIKKKPSIKQIVRLNMFRAGLINSVLAGCGFLFFSFYNNSSIKSEKKPKKGQKKGKLFWLYLFLIAVLALSLRINLARGGLWADEVWLAKHSIHGEFQPTLNEKNLDKEVHFVKASWQKCLWYFRKPTNHIFYGFLSKISLNFWKFFTNSAEEQFSEIMIRMPSLIAGIISIILIALYAEKFFGRNLAILTALLMSIHPYHIYLSANARAYSITIMLCLLYPFVIEKIIYNNTCKYWLILAIMNFLLIWNFMLNVFLVVIINMYFVFIMFSKKKKIKENFIYYSSSIFLSIILLIELFLQNIYQLQFMRLSADVPFNLHLLFETLSKYLFGIPFFSLGNEAGISWPYLLSLKNLLLFIIIILIIFLSAIIILFFKRNSNEKNINKQKFTYPVLLLISAFIIISVVYINKQYYFVRFPCLDRKSTRLNSSH